MWWCGLGFKISRTLILVGLVDWGLIRSTATVTGEFTFSFCCSFNIVDYSVPEYRVNLSMTSEFFICEGATDRYISKAD